MDQVPETPISGFRSTYGEIGTRLNQSCILGGILINDVRSLGGRGVSKNLMLLNKISKFYTIKVWQGGSKILEKDLTSFKDGPKDLMT